MTPLIVDSWAASFFSQLKTSWSPTSLWCCSIWWTPPRTSCTAPSSRWTPPGPPCPGCPADTARSLSQSSADTRPSSRIYLEMKTFWSVIVTHLNRGIMVVDEVVLDILESESGLTDSAVTEHHDAVPIWRNVNNMTHDKMLIIVAETIAKQWYFLW